MCDFVWFYSTHYKFYIHLPCIITQQRTTAPFYKTWILSFSDFQSPRLYQGSADCCEGYRNSDVIFLIRLSLTIHYCNQSVLAIFPDIISRSTWYSTFLLRISYLYNSTVTKVLQFWFILDLRFPDHHCHFWLHCIVTTKIWYYSLCCFVWFFIILFDGLYSFTLH